MPMQNQTGLSKAGAGRTGKTGTAPAALQRSISACRDDGAHVRTSSNQ